jgi:hypothetical protein
MKERKINNLLVVASGELFLAPLKKREVSRSFVSNCLFFHRDVDS